MTQYAGQAKYPTTIPLTDANTPFNSSAVNAPDAANRDAIVALKTKGFYSTTFDANIAPYTAPGGLYYNTGNYALLGALFILNTDGISIKFPVAHTYSRVAHVNAYAKSDGVGNYWLLGPTFAPPKGYYVQKNPSSGPSSDGALIFDVDLPSNCTVTRAYVRFKPATGHGALPSVQPFLYVYIVDSSNGTTTLVDSVQSAAGAVGTYEGSVQTISCTFSQAFDAGRYRIFLVVFGEHGTDTVTDLQMYPPVVEFTRAQIGEELGEFVP